MKSVSTGSNRPLLDDVLTSVDSGILAKCPEDIRTGCLIVIDYSGVVVAANDIVCEQLDCEPGHVLGKNMGDIDCEFPNPFIPRVWQAQVQYAPMQRYGQFCLQGKRGFSVRMLVLGGVVGEEPYFVVAGQPISDRERIEAALVHSRNQLRAIIDSEPECVKLVSKEGVLLEMNPAGLEMVEAECAEDVLGQEISLVVDEADRGLFEALNEEAFRGKSGVGEFRIKGLRGTRRWMETHVTPLKDPAGKVIAALSVTRDISERKRSEELLRRLLEGTGDTVGKRFFEKLLSAVCETLDMEVALVGEVVERENGQRWIESHCLLNQGQFIEHFEYDLKGTPCEGVVDGRVCYFERDVARTFPEDEILVRMGIESYVGIPLKSDGGDVVGILSVLDQKPASIGSETLSVFQLFAGRASAELNRIRRQRHERELEQRLQAAQRMESIGTLAGGIAHDFNNILCAIMSNADLAKLDLDEKHPAFESVDEIGKASRRASSLVAQIMTFSRREPPVRKAVDLKETVMDAGKMMRSLIPATVGFSVDVHASLPFVLADSNQIHQLVVNLTTNAWHALQDGNGEVRLLLEPRTIEEEVTLQGIVLKAGQYVVLEVADDGEGIDPETRERIFDPFFTTKDAGKGAGIGLAVVHGIVKAHDASIVVDSKRGAGTKFTVYFPAADALRDDNGTTAAVVGEDVFEGKGRRILFLDDEVAVASAAGRWLRLMGFEVASHSVPEEAIEYFRDHGAQVDLVCVDYYMPRLSGIDVARHIRQGNQAVPIILASGNLDAATKARALREGVTAVLEKPYSQRELVRTLKAVL